MGLVKEEDHAWLIQVTNFWRASEERIEQLMQMVDKLPADERMLLTLYYYEDEIVFDEEGHPVVRQVRRKRELPEDEGMGGSDNQNGLREEEVNFNNL